LPIEPEFRGAMPVTPAASDLGEQDAELGLKIMVAGARE